jgi:hypothetical protein
MRKVQTRRVGRQSISIDIFDSRTERSAMYRRNPQRNPKEDSGDELEAN